jgi:dihydropteroate synthase
MQNELNTDFSISSLLSKNHPLIVGVLNCTPDSFSDGGEVKSTQEAINKGLSLIEDGANCIDIGGVSTGPGSQPISEEEELARILKAVKALASHTIVSVDTYRASVAKECLKVGAKIINDVSALRADPGMAKVIHDFGCPAILMYSKETGAHPHVTTNQIEYSDCTLHIIEFLKERVDFALSQGITSSQIIIDPGMGQFVSSDAKYSWEILKRLSEIEEALPEFPLLVGTSRKGFLGGDISERDPASSLTSLIAYSNGAKILRTHNVKMLVEFLKIKLLLR